MQLKMQLIFPLKRGGFQFEIIYLKKKKKIVA